MKRDKALGYPKSVRYLRLDVPGRGVLTVERWVYEGWRKGELSPELSRDLDEAVSVWPSTRGMEPGDEL